MRKLELIKEILGDSSVKVDKQRIKFVQEYFRDEIEKEQAIQAHGYRAYYTDKIKAFWQFWQSYGYAVYVAIMLVILAVLIFQLFAGIITEWLAGTAWLPGISFALTAFEAAFLLVYIFCKTHRKKWEAAAGLAVLLLLNQGWNLFSVGYIAEWQTIILFPLLFLTAYHYGKWKKEFAEKAEELRQWLRDGEFPDDEIIRMYHALETLRFEGGRKAGMLKQDEEVDEMLLYLNWLKRDETAAQVLEEIRTDAIAETYEGLELPEPVKKDEPEPEAIEHKEPLSWNRIKQELVMPLLYVVLFPVFYLAVQWFFNAGKQDTDMGGMLICAAVITALILLVMAVFGREEKDPRRKFWLELIPALGLEIMIAFDIYCLVSGYYMEQGARGLKSFVLFLCVGIPWFAAEAAQTQKNWKRMLSAEETDKTE